MEKYENLKYIIPYVIILLFFVVGLILAFTRIHFTTQKKIYRDEISKGKLEIKHQKELLNKAIQIQEDERKRIGRIIHDDIGNRIHILSICVQDIEMKEGRSKDILLSQLPLLSDATRTLAHDMYPVEIEYLGFMGMLEEMQMYLSKNIHFQIHASGSFHIHQLQTELQIYRIIQEFLNNVLKYASASTVVLNLRQTKKYISLALCDDGIGFSMSEVKKGMGMNNIEYRVNALFGIHKWKSSPDKGTSLIIKIQNTNEK